MGLFDKKFCDICGEKIGLLGNRRLEDGNMCKDCARLLSPFFTGRKKSSVAEIKEQLLYREKNKAELRMFSPGMTLGEYYKFYIDTAKGNFVVSRKRPSDWDDENPDIIPLSSVYGCNVRTEEETEEIYAINSEGEEVSYNPPRYKTLYDFCIVMNVNHPYFDEIEVKINDDPVDGMGSMDYNRYMQMCQQITSYFSGGAMNAGFNQAPAYNQQMNYQQPQPNMYAQPQPYAQPNMYAQPQQYAQPNMYAQPYQYGQPVANQYQQPMQGWTCRSCNSMNTAGNFCAFCGAPKG